jgi:hypothetical protein
VDSLKVLDPDGRLEKWTTLSSTSGAQPCVVAGGFLTGRP